jgi:beta-galactosidase
VRLRGAEALATFRGGTLDGQPAVTRQAFRDGSAYYLATRLSRPVMAQLLRRVWTECGVRPVADVPAGVEAVRRGSLLFLMNHGQQTVEVQTVAGSLDLLTESNQVVLGPREVAIVQDDERGVGA